MRKKQQRKRQRTLAKQERIASELSNELQSSAGAGEQTVIYSQTEQEEEEEEEEEKEEVGLSVGTALEVPGHWWHNCKKSEKHQLFPCTIVAFGTAYEGASATPDQRWIFILDDDEDQRQWGIKETAHLYAV